VSLHKDLLDQAGHLAKREPKRPKQASLRRAVSVGAHPPEALRDEWPRTS
jgi:hypothetical protein